MEYTTVILHEDRKETEVRTVFNTLKKKILMQHIHCYCVMSKAGGHEVVFCLLTL